MLFELRRNTVGISGAKFDVVGEGCKPTGITRSSEFAEKSCPAQTYLGRVPASFTTLEISSFKIGELFALW
jgi:hypothetical protein